MKIQIDGTNTVNKGAELMFFAIFEEIERRIPNAIAYFNSNNPSGNRMQVDSVVTLKERLPLVYSKYPNFILNKLGLTSEYFSSKFAMKGIDLVLDGGGFQFSDQWNYSDSKLKTWENYYQKLKENGSKLVLLPQAFGPFITKNGRRSVEMISEYADIIIARERVSLNYLLEAGASPGKVWQFSDFTLLVKGKLPKGYDFVRGAVCIIPNQKMVTHTDGTSDDYIDFMVRLVDEFKSRGKEVFLLNHEGLKDLELCNEINRRVKSKLEIISGLTSKEIKGIIGASWMVVSSRFHGVASALNQGIPCLATSWNHKYEELFKDFGQEGRIIDFLGKSDLVSKKIDEVIENHNEIKRTLEMRKTKLIEESNEMWNSIWNFCGVS